MSDPIGKSHKLNLTRGLRSKSLHMQWKYCKLAAHFHASGEFEELIPKRKNSAMFIGKVNHAIIETIPEVVDIDEMKGLYTKAQIADYLVDLFDWDDWANAQGFIPYIEYIILYESQRWLDCMAATPGSMRDVLTDWHVRYNEVYIENEELGMALRVDRLERIPGTINSYALMEIKKKVRGTIRQELAWYYVGMQEWADKQHYCEMARAFYLPNHPDQPRTLYYHCGDNNCPEVGINITHWGALDLEDSRRTFVSKISKVSISTLRKNLGVFSAQMDELASLKTRHDKLLFLDQFKEKRIMPSIMCAYCDYQQLCYDPVMFEMYGGEYGELASWEKDKITRLIQSDEVTLRADNQRSFTETIEYD